MLKPTPVKDTEGHDGSGLWGRSGRGGFQALQGFMAALGCRGLQRFEAVGARNYKL